MIGGQDIKDPIMGVPLDICSIEFIHTTVDTTNMNIPTDMSTPTDTEIESARTIFSDLQRKRKVALMDEEIASIQQSDRALNTGVTTIQRDQP